MLKKRKSCIWAFLLGICLFFAACGEEAAVQPSEEEPSSLTYEDTVGMDGVTDWDKMNQLMGVDASEIETSGEEDEEVPENVILIAARTKDYSLIYDIVRGFNKSQSEYRAEIKNYEDRDSMLLDLVKGKGCDILTLTPTYLATLTDKGALEDLSPYFEDSEVVDREDLFPCVWETGSVGDRMVGVIPFFKVNAILVEKGYTENGAWNVDEYLALMDKYPDVPLSGNIMEPENGWFWVGQELTEMSESYVDWDGRTCDFENETFIETMEKLKSYLEKCEKLEKSKDDTAVIFNRAASLHQKQMQTLQVELGCSKYFYNYKQIRDTFFDAFELAGYPTQDKTVKYPIQEYDSSVIWGMNASTEKKEGAWKLLEYMLSGYQQELAEAWKQDFPVRRDIVEKMLDEEIAADPEDMSFSSINSFTGEKDKGRKEFTEEDKGNLLYILDHATPPSAMGMLSGSDVWKIYRDEIKVFFEGEKTAEETAHILQNRISLYLSE